jgi:hypothetical protein
LVIAGIVAQLLTVKSQKVSHYRSGGLGSANWKARAWRNLAGFGLIFAFSFALFSVMHPHARQVGAYWPLLFGCIYAGAGLWTGTRYVVAGVVLFVATLVGYFFLRDYFFFWMAAFGGGTLILTGFWMRRA